MPFTDAAGLTDYNAFVRALNILTQNRDPFSGLPYPIDMSGMTILVSAASEIQVKFMLQAETFWQVAANLTAAGGLNTISSYNMLRNLKLNVKTSQLWMNRLLDVEVTTLAANGTYAHLGFNATAGFATAATINSAFFMGHFKDAVHYATRNPYTVMQVPLSSTEYAEEVVLVQDVRERGQAYWVNPRIVYRAWARRRCGPRGSLPTAGPGACKEGYTMALKTWDGSASGVIETAANWDTGTAPGIGDTIKIPAGGLAQYPSSGTLPAAFNGVITVDAGGEITGGTWPATAGTLTNNGEITAARSPARWSTIWT